MKSNMAYKDELIEFTIGCFKRTGKQLVTNDIHSHVLKDRYENFFGPRPESDYKFHRWAGSLKSSQALAYNIFSGVNNRFFEYDMWALDRNPLHKACVDVAFEDKKNTVHLFEVKMFEFANSDGKNTIFHKKAQEKYFDPNNYKVHKENAGAFIPFIKNVQEYFAGQPVYGEGIKQLCCHLLGIVNEMTIPNGKLFNKTAELYSLCYDNPFSQRFAMDVENYKMALGQFGSLVDNYLEKINKASSIKYGGFLPVSEYISENAALLGVENCNYVLNRYYNQSGLASKSH